MRWLLTFVVAVLVGIALMLILTPLVGDVTATVLMVFSQLAVWIGSYALTE